MTESIEEFVQPQHEQHVDQEHRHAIHFIVDGEPFETYEHELTPNEIIRTFGEQDPATNYLVEIDGRHNVSFQENGDTPIKLHEGEKFQIVSTGPTTVSDFAKGTGVDVFFTDLLRLGYNPTTLPGMSDHVVIDYEVQTGKFAGKKVRHGFVIPPDFPMTPPSGPHVSPRIHPNLAGGEHPTGGVHDSPFTQALGGDWQYWSRPFPNWKASRKAVATYMSHILRLWDTQ